MSAHERHMRRALDLVRRARHRTSPNPLVGCVVVHDGQVVGEGVTQPVGGPHAEIVALRQAGPRARGADVYVTLEPCCHHGRTPPCTDALVAAGVGRVHAGVIDPNPLVSGWGLRALQAAGIEAGVGLLGDACSAVIAPFRRFILEGRPWVVLKAGTSLDGRIAVASGDSRWITGPAARRDAHRLRARLDAVLVGARTALADDPRLDVRDVPGANPLRVVADPRLDLPPTARLLGPGSVVFHGPDAEPARATALRATGAALAAVPAGPSGGIDLRALLGDLARRGVVGLLVEGGGRLHGALLAARLADEAVFYVAPRLLGRGRPVLDLPSAPSVAGGWHLEPVSIRRFGDDVCVRGLIRYPAAADLNPDPGAPCSPV